MSEERAIVKVFREGSVRAVIYRATDAFGDSFFSVELLRTYLDDDAQCRGSASYSGANVLRAIKCLCLALRWLKQQRPAREERTPPRPIEQPEPWMEGYE